MTSFSLEALLALYSVPTIGPTRMRKLISVFQTPQAVLDASVRQLTEVESIDVKTAEKIKTAVDWPFVRRQMDYLANEGAGVLTFWDKAYPQRLKAIFDPPAFLFYKGNLDCLNVPAFAVVGTRKPTGYGRQVTRKLAEELVDNGFAIISGFARGVDTIAHSAALERGGKTVAVFGNGVDRVYPAENRQLYAKMIERGLLLSEYPMGTAPDAGNFPKRNRIISGLSVGVLVTEAGEKSGALLTAMYAADQNREVFAVPGSVLSAKSKGVHRLIKDGAKLTEDIADILEEVADELNLSGQKGKVTAKPAKEFNLTGNLKKIYDLLSDEPLHVDQLAVQAELSPSEVLSSLLTLELMGAIRQMAGKMFIRR